MDMSEDFGGYHIRPTFPEARVHLLTNDIDLVYSDLVDCQDLGHCVCLPWLAAVMVK